MKLPMTDKTDLIREIHEYVTTHGGENTATHLLVQAASAIQAQAAELEAIGAGGVSGPLMGQPQAMPDLSALTERGAKAWAGVDAQELRGGGADMSKEREDFERWARDDFYSGFADIAGDRVGTSYRDMAHHMAWYAFQAGRASLAASPTPPAQQAAPKAAPGEPVESAAKGAIMGAAYDFRDAHISGSINLKRSAHAILEAAVDSALAAPQQEAQEPSRAAKTWCSYVAGMIGCYLNEPDESTKVQAIAGIIERRLWALPTPQPAPDCHHRPPCNECAALAAKERQP